MANWADNLRYDHPGTYRALWVAGIVTAGFIVFFMFPDSPLFRAMGVTGAQKRVSALGNALYWSSRAAMNNKSSSDKPRVLYGNMEGVSRDGKLILTVPNGSQWVRYNFALADTVITDIYGVAQRVGALRLEDAKFEVYLGDQAVVWVRGVPFNVKLIEDGVATPDPSPPTDIIDLAFATYYWNIVKGKPAGGKL